MSDIPIPPALAAQAFDAWKREFDHARLVELNLLAQPHLIRLAANAPEEVDDAAQAWLGHHYADVVRIALPADVTPMHLIDAFVCGAVWAGTQQS